MNEHIFILIPEHIAITDYVHFLYKNLVDTYLLDYSFGVLRFINKNMVINVFHSDADWKARGYEVSNLIIQGNVIFNSLSNQDFWYSRVRTVEKEVYFTNKVEDTAKIIKDIIKKRNLL